MKQYEVTGMSCAACSARVEKAVSKVPGVTSCSVSLLTNSMGVEGTARKARKPVEYNHAVLQQLRLRHIRRQHLQRFLRRQIFFPDELLKALVNCPQIF